MADFSTGDNRILSTDTDVEGARIYNDTAEGNLVASGTATVNIQDFIVRITHINTSGNNSFFGCYGPNATFNGQGLTVDFDALQGNRQFQNQRGTINLTDFTMYSTNGGNVNWGCFNSGADAAPTFNLRNGRFYGSPGGLFPNFSDIDPASVLEGLRFYNGNADDPLGAFLEAGQLQSYPGPIFGPSTRARSGFSNSGALGRAIIRVNNQDNRGGGTSAGWSPYSQIDLRAIPLAGGRGVAPDGTTGTNINALCISVDRNVGMWLINPLLPDFSAAGPAGVVVDNSLYWVGTSAPGSDNPQTRRIPTNTDPARIASFHGWNPRVQDSVTTAQVADAKIRFNDAYLTVPATYAYGTAPATQAAGVRTAAQVTSDNGYLFQNQSHDFDESTAATNRTVYNDPTLPENVEMDFTFPTRTGKLYSLTHGTGNEIGMNFSLAYPAAGQDLTQAGTTVDTLTSFTAASIDWGTTSTYPLTEDVYYGYGTNQTQVSSLDNIYPSIKTDYYDRAPAGFIGIGAEGSGDNTITFSRDTTMQTASSHLVQAGSVRVRTTGSLTLGSRITNLRISGSANTLELGAVTYPSGITIEGVNSGEIRATGTTLSSNTRVGGEVWSAISSGSLSAGLTFLNTGEYTMPSGTTSFTLSNAAFENNAVVTLRTAGSPITVMVPESQNGTTPGFRAGTNVTLANIPAAAVTNTLNVDTSVGGFFTIRQNVGGSDTEVRSVLASRFEAGASQASLNLPSFSSSEFGAGDTISVYIKYDSDLSTRTYYQEGIQTFNFNTAMDAVHQVNIPVPVASALVGSAVTAVPSNFAIDSSTYTTGASGDLAPANNTALVTVSNSSGDTALDITQTSGLPVAAAVANTAAYFQSWYTNRGVRTTPIAEFAQNAIVNWDVSRITFASGNVSNNFRVQHVIRNWGGVESGSFALARTGAGEVSPQISGAASIGTVIAAIDGSNVGVQVGDMHNYLGNTAGNPILTSPQGGFDRTDSAANYGQNIERT